LHDIRKISRKRDSAMYKGREGWPFSIKKAAGEEVPVEAVALPGDPVAGGTARSEISAQYKDLMDRGVIPVSEPVGWFKTPTKSAATICNL
jgi:hypothetical protein